MHLAAIAETECKVAKMTEEHHAETKKLAAEIERLKQELECSQKNYDAKNLDYWELSGKVEAYEMCIKAFTGMKED